MIDLALWTLLAAASFTAWWMWPFRGGAVDIESRLTKASTPATVEQLKAQGVKNVRVVTKGMLNQMVKEAIDQVIAERGQAMTLPEVARVGALVEQELGKDAVTQLNEKLSSIEEIVRGLSSSGRLSETAAVAAVEMAKTSLSKLMTGMDVESNVGEVGVKNIESDGVQSGLERLKGLGGQA